MKKFKCALLMMVTTGIITAVASADIVIHPNVAPRERTAVDAFERAPIFDRMNARDIARVEAASVESIAEPGMLRDGVVHAFARKLRVVAPLSRITVDGATATRLRFDGIAAGTVMWLAGSEDEELMRFEPSETAVWGPTTRGSEVYIAVEGASKEVTISAFAQIEPAIAANTSCFSDVACSTREDLGELNQLSRAIGYVRFIRNGKSYVCTGGLLNDAANSGTPYFLTARHCISTQEEASSVEVVWDLRSDACGSNRMAPVTRSHGAQLLVSSSTTDVALLKLATIPANRVFLGVDLRPLAPGTAVHRVSHASGLSQTYSSGMIEQSGLTCATAPRPEFVYTRQQVGATSQGSSGAPLLIPGLYVVGQMLGLCGPDPTNSCATYNFAVDGTLREAWGHLAPYLDPTSVGNRRRAVN